MISQIQMRLRFGPFVLDSSTRELLRGSEPLHLSPKEFDVLQVLIAQRPAVVSKTALLEAVWPDAAVEEVNVGNAIVAIRKALGEEPASPTYIWTVPRRGYRFGAEVEDLAPTPAAARNGRYPRWWLTWKGAILPLVEGENIVGRHPASAVWISGKSVSREHARIVIAADGVTIEDQGSTNGTFVDGKAITARHPLHDGSTITFGSEKATFRQWSDETAVGTEVVRKKWSRRSDLNR